MIRKYTLKSALVFLFFIFSISVQGESVWIDVRTSQEHEVNQIQGDLLIPHGQISEDIVKHYPNKETQIHLYCRSGKRAGKAKSDLNKMGYKNVFNEGSIENARKVRGLLLQK